MRLGMHIYVVWWSSLNGLGEEELPKCNKTWSGSKVEGL